MVISFFCAFIISCTSVRNFQVSCVESNKSGYYTIKVSHLQRKYFGSYNQARKDAIHAILYSGFSQTKECNTLPPLLDTEQKRNEFKLISSSFFSKEGLWSQYTASEPIIFDSAKSKSKKEFYVVVSYEQLKLYLMEKQVLQPYNKIF
jgi:hypothetical protein